MSTRRGPATRVLVVDDSEGVRSYLASLLELRGYAVDTAGDGRSALALARVGRRSRRRAARRDDAGVDGLETLRRLRARIRGCPW